MAKRAPKSDDPDTPRSDASPAPAAPTHAITLLDHLINHDNPKQHLARALSSGRIHHAWIFHGPVGVGKRTAAVAFAAALLDPTTSPGLGGNLAPEPDSQVQRLIASGTHPDLHIITKELAAISREEDVRKGKQFGIAKDVVEEFLIEPALKSRALPGDSRASKVFIVDEAELLGPLQQNSLLKLMEEPPAGTIIILITSAEERLLPTIRSRCQRIRFSPLDEPAMNTWLARRAGDGGGAGLAAIPPEKRSWLLRFAAGSPGAADIAITNDLFTWDQVLREPLQLIEQGRFSIGLGEVMAKLIDERAAAHVKQHPDASKDAANKAWARRLLAFLSEDLRSKLRASTQGLTAVAIEQDAASRRLLNAIDALNAAETFMSQNVNMTLLLENLAVQMSAEPVGV